MMRRAAIVRPGLAAAFGGILVLGLAAFGREGPAPTGPDDAARRLSGYFERMSVPKPFLVRTGADWTARRDDLRRRILRDIALDPLPERVPLELHYSEPIEHPWCVIRRVAYQLWPGVYSRGLLLMPREFPERPAPAVLCLHGHTDDGYADADEQTRYLTFAKLGYVVLVTPQDHHEDLARGLSHQTYMVWNNMRGLDLLRSLPEVDAARIGVNGLSGGGLQTQMLLALDPRVKAATIGGITCEYREETFAWRNHCECNHWPGAMTYTDQPEIATLGFPAPVQFLTMDDWTRNFGAFDFPTVQAIYRENGFPDRAECVYWPTGHMYDTAKRERTYWWAERWVRGKAGAGIPAEPDGVRIVSPPKALLALPVAVPGERSYEDFRRTTFRRDDAIAPGPEGWKAYRERMADALHELLGVAQALPVEGEIATRTVKAAWAGGARVEEWTVPSEGEISVPALVIAPPPGVRVGGIEVILGDRRREAADANGAGLARKARRGMVVVLPDIRFTGDYGARSLAGKLGPDLLRFKQAAPLSVPKEPDRQAAEIAGAWDRNGVLWSRPVTGMMIHDLLRVIDAVTEKDEWKGSPVRVTARDSAGTAAAALFGACLEARIKAIDADFRGFRYEKTPAWRDDLTALPLVTRILLHGDIPQWAAILADRTVTLRNLPMSPTERRRLEGAFARLGNPRGLRIRGPES